MTPHESERVLRGVSLANPDPAWIEDVEKRLTRRARGPTLGMRLRLACNGLMLAYLLAWWFWPSAGLMPPPTITEVEGIDFQPQLTVIPQVQKGTIYAISS